MHALLTECCDQRVAEWHLLTTPVRAACGQLALIVATAAPTGWLRVMLASAKVLPAGVWVLGEFC